MGSNPAKRAISRHEVRLSDQPGAFHSLPPLPTQSRLKRPKGHRPGPMAGGFTQKENIGMVTMRICFAIAMVALFVTACGSAGTPLRTSPIQAASAFAVLEDRMEIANEQLGQNLFTAINFNVPDARVELTVSDLWNATAEDIQDSIVDDWMVAWSVIAGNSGWTGLARVRFIDLAGKEVANKTRTIPEP